MYWSGYQVVFALVRIEFILYLTEYNKFCTSQAIMIFLQEQGAHEEE